MHAFAALLSVVVLAGCGARAPAEPTRATTLPPAATVPPPSPTPTPRRPVIRVSSPRPRTVVTGRPAGLGTLRAAVVVRGRSLPDARVGVSSGCTHDRCTVFVHADRSGMWRATVVVLADGSGKAKLAAQAQGSPIRLVPIRVEGEAPGDVVRTATPPPAPTPAPERRLALLGDSLGVGIEPLLPGLLPGWSVVADDREGRPLAEGLGRLGRLDLSRPTVVAVSLFTNDGPEDLDALTAGVRRVRSAAGDRGCVVWATIVRPPLAGVSYAAANQRLEALAREPGGAPLVLVPWARAVAANPGWLAPDGVHGTVVGYRERARLYAEAVRSCAG